MSGAEALARAMCIADGLDPDAFDPEDDECRQNWRMWQTQAERILADPAPLLAALAEAGVLREERDERAVQIVRRYVSEWEASK